MDSQPIHILLVDDNPRDRDLAIAMLKSYVNLRYEIGECRSMSEAKRYLAEKGADVILLDLGLPDTHDIETVRALRRIDANSPLIVFTGENSEDKGIQALQEGAQEYLRKDELTPAGLSKAIRYAVTRTKLQNELRQAHKLEEEANRKLKETQAQLVHSTKMSALGQLTAGICHEMNNPLSSLMGHLDTIGRASETLASHGTPEEGEATAEKIRQRCIGAREGLQRITDLVDKLKIFSRIDEAPVKEIDVLACIDATLHLLQHKYEGRIEVEVERCDDARLICMPNELSQALLNLLVNAIEAIEGKGAIRIFTRRTDSEFVIGIADTGPGVSADISDHMFEPFFTTKPVGANTGLGLSVCHEIVRAHNGRLIYEPNTPHGCVFTMILPHNLGEELRKSA